MNKGAGRINGDTARWISIVTQLYAIFCGSFRNLVAFTVLCIHISYRHSFIAGLFFKENRKTRRIDKVAPYILIYIFIKIVIGLYK